MTSTPSPSRESLKRAAAAGDVEQLIKTRRRVRVYGEVFTPRHMVHQMLDLVARELETGPNFVDKTFLEPAAGDGNFLIAILHRKLAAIEKRYQPRVWPAESLFALASIYGVELLEDNHAAAKAGMLAEFMSFHERHGAKVGPRTNLFRAATFLIDSNVVCGNTLTGLDRTGQPITFSWWNRVLNVPATVQREPFTLSSLRREDNGMFSFDILPTYAQCRIDHVQQEARADA